MIFPHKCRFILQCATFLVCLLIPSVTSAQTSDQPKAQATSQPKSQVSTQQDPYTVAVRPFKGDEYTYNGVSLHPGRDIAKILEGRLSKEKFEIITRTDLGEVLAEQKLAAGEGFSQEGAPNAGQLEGVEYVVTGNITQFNIEEGETKVNVHIFGKETKKSPDLLHVSMEVNVVDTDSGRVVASATCRRAIEIGKGTSSSEVLLFATAKSDEGDRLTAIHDAYYTIADDLAQQINTTEFQTRSAKVVLNGTVGFAEDDRVYIKMGRNKGVTTKMVFNVYRKYKGMDITIAEIKPVNVDEEQSECKIIRLTKDSNGTPKVIKAGDTFKTKVN